MKQLSLLSTNPLDHLKNGKIKSCKTSGNDLLWNEDLGYGYLESNGFDYGETYWKQYCKYARNEISKPLNEFRYKFVDQYVSLTYNSHTVCDVGIGTGEFVMKAGVLGYDVNPIAVEWLEYWRVFADPYIDDRPKALTFWDVLEHIDDPSPLLNRYDKFFISIPIHENLDACLVSKHLKPNEHIWHFTDRGLKMFMANYGLTCIEKSSGEIELGREGIFTYYFKRKSIF